MTMAEKILARTSGQKEVKPGQVVVCTVDLAVQSDASFGGYWMMEAWPAVVFDRERVILTTGASAPATGLRSAETHSLMRRFAAKHDIKYFYDVGRGGIIHQVLAENGHTLPGTLLAAGDSHTAAAGAFNCVARGLGGPEMLYVAATGEAWYLIGRTIKFVLEGTLGPNVYPRDIVHWAAGEYGDYVGRNLEWVGPAVAEMSIASRQTIATESVEMSVEFATFEADDKTIEYVKARSDKPFTPVFADPDAEYEAVHTIQLDKIVPTVALPGSVPKNTAPADQLKDIKITQAYVGSCANGRAEDLAEVARVLKGKKVHPSVRLIVVPASYQEYKEAVKAGYVETILDANAVVGAAGCGACGGGSNGVLGPEDVCITASTRNFQGRMGSPMAPIYMGSPATVAASAVTGRITDPREID
jgi:3-isopropylmalate/(R)-2-methylmalate dehydratase large subunit